MANEIEVKTYYIRFDFNGGTTQQIDKSEDYPNGYLTISNNNSYAVEENDSLPLPSPNQIVNRGYVLLGWSLAQYNNGGTTEQDNFKKIIYAKEFTPVDEYVSTDQNAPTKLYAVWKSLTGDEPKLSIRTNVTDKIVKSSTDKISSMLESEDESIRNLGYEALNSVVGAYNTQRTTAYFVYPKRNDPTTNLTAAVTVDYVEGSLSEIKTAPQYINSVVGEYPISGATTYVMSWKRKGVEVDDSTIVANGDTFYGEPIEMGIMKKVVALPVVDNDGYKEIIENKEHWALESDIFSTHSDKFDAARNYGNVTIICGNTSVNTDGMSLPGEGLDCDTTKKVTLIATPKNGACFLGWYRREYSVSNEAGELDKEVILGYYLKSTETTYKISVDRGDDMYNQYAALFSVSDKIEDNTKLSEIPFEAGAYWITDIESDLGSNIDKDSDNPDKARLFGPKDSTIKFHFDEDKTVVACVKDGYMPVIKQDSEVLYNFLFVGDGGEMYGHLRNLDESEEETKYDGYIDVLGNAKGELKNYGDGVYVSEEMIVEPYTIGVEYVGFCGYTTTCVGEEAESVFDNLKGTKPQNGPLTRPFVIEDINFALIVGGDESIPKASLYDGGDMQEFSPINEFKDIMNDPELHPSFQEFENLIRVIKDKLTEADIIDDNCDMKEGSEWYQYGTHLYLWFNQDMQSAADIPVKHTIVVRFAQE